MDLTCSSSIWYYNSPHDVIILVWSEVNYIYASIIHYPWLKELVDWINDLFQYGYLQNMKIIDLKTEYYLQLTWAYNIFTNYFWWCVLMTALRGYWLLVWSGFNWQLTRNTKDHDIGSSRAFLSSTYYGIFAIQSSHAINLVVSTSD